MSYCGSIYLHCHLPIACFIDSWSYFHKKTNKSITGRRQKILGVGSYNFFYSRLYPWRLGLLQHGKRENNLPEIHHNLQQRLKASVTTETFIQCPECGTVYSIEAEEIESQRAVRCGDCLHEWLATEDDLLEMDPVYINLLLNEREQIKEDAPFGKLEKERDLKLLSTVQDDNRDKTEPSQNEKITRNVVEPPKREGEKVLFVGNLSYKASEKDLFRVFSSCGQVFDVRIPRNNPKAHRGFAFVRMNFTGASTALQRLQGANIVGRPIVLSESMTQGKTTSQEEEDVESGRESNGIGLDEDVLEEDWDTDFGPDEQLLGQEAYSNGLRFYLRGSTSRKSPNGKI
ncbi:hypothetical protein GpartN1_g542.t1 [Galdieria partita]|uniref:RRM domain-containing protein n=1 Tax=Galdieria partita TaxID=83374 RepID=A0A9C7PQW6_9RHOD|nr:hypothetical protein GpartN1_g542.t1 [Galdieria partita]